MKAAAPRSMIWRTIPPRPASSPANSRVHFISDTPPPASVARLEQVFRDTGGDLKALAIDGGGRSRRLDAGPGKMRAPVEYRHRHLSAAGLAAGRQNAQRQIQAAMQACRMMGQFPMAAPSPKGWSDSLSDWSGPDAVLSRIALARQLARTPAADIGAAPGGASWPMKPWRQRLTAATRAAMPPPPMPARRWRCCCPAPNSNGDRSHGTFPRLAPHAAQEPWAPPPRFCLWDAPLQLPSPPCRATGDWWS